MKKAMNDYVFWIIVLLAILFQAFVAHAGSVEVRDTYQTYTNHTIGFYLAITAVLTFVFIMFERLWAKK